MAKQTALGGMGDDWGRTYLSRVGAAVRAGSKEVLAGWGVRPQEYVILLILDAGSGASQQELCAAANIDSGNMVDLLDGLEALGYATRARDSRDRRRYVVTISSLGRSAVGELRQAIQEYNTGLLSPLTEPERHLLATSLGKLYARTAEGQPPAPRQEPKAPARLPRQRADVSPMPGDENSHAVSSVQQFQEFRRRQVCLPED